MNIAKALEKTKVDQLKQLCNGPIWDGNLISKDDRDFLFHERYVDRVEGWNILTMEGVKLALQIRLLKT
jgi:hypothetical protein